MAKLATLRLLEGSLEHGIKVMLTISRDGSTEPDIDTNIYYLPSNTDLAETLNQWRFNYKSLTEIRMQTGWQSLNETNAESRDTSLSPDTQTQQNRLENLRNLDRDLRSQMQVWMESDSFRGIREAFLTQLMNEEVRILVRSKDTSLLEIPWHLWDLIDANKQAEVALSASEAQPMSKPDTTNSLGKVRILAIMSNSEGIDTESDEQSIHNLPNAEPVFLHEEKWSTIHSHLWNQNWDILFFVGHSSVDDNGQTRFCINRNKNDNPTIDEFRCAIRNAVERGLQLAIFNSCDVLGIGFDVQKLHLPHSIVMRSPIYDQVAQKFLSNFLTNFANGMSLYLAEKDAREQLEGLENEFSGISWLLVIVQSPAAHRHSLTWKDLCGGNFHRRRLLLSFIVISSMILTWFLIPKLIPDKLATLVSVECTSDSNGQECDRTGDYTFEADGYSLYDFKIEASTRCSKVMHSLEWKDSGGGKKYTRFLGSRESDTITLDHKFSRGIQVVKIGGMGKIGGCNSGKLGKWKVRITATPRSLTAPIVGSYEWERHN